MKFEDEGPLARDLDRSSDECLAVFAPEYLPKRRRADQYVVPVGKVVAAVSPAVIEIGDPRNDDLLGAYAFADKEIAISLACDAESPIVIAPFFMFLIILQKSLPEKPLQVKKYGTEKMKKQQTASFVKLALTRAAFDSNN